MGNTFTISAPSRWASTISLRVEAPGLHSRPLCLQKFAVRRSITGATIKLAPSARNDLASLLFMTVPAPRIKFFKNIQGVWRSIGEFYNAYPTCVKRIQNLDRLFPIFMTEHGQHSLVMQALGYKLLGVSFHSLANNPPRRSGLNKMFNFLFADQGIIAL
jgi:hypothetical protein